MVAGKGSGVSSIKIVRCQQGILRGENTSKNMGGRKKTYVWSSPRSKTRYLGGSKKVVNR